MSSIAMAAFFEGRSRPPVLLGTVLGGRYLVVRQISAGGYGAVYEARELAGDRRVAIKVARPRFDLRADVDETLAREAQAALLVEHPGVVRPIELGEDGDGRFLVMEYVDAPSLHAIIAERAPLPVDEACAIAMGVLDVLAAAHGSGVVHRDIKPENVLVLPSKGGEPRVKVLDFGLARFAGEPAARGEPLAGTPAYMAPERAAGQPGGPTADLWAVGVLLYEMLTGALPFEGGTPAEVIARIRYGDPPPLRAVSEAVPAALEAVVLRAMDRDPTRRPSSAAELTLDLEPFARAIRGSFPLGWRDRPATEAAA